MKRALIMAAACAFVGACATVKPYERERLSRSDMQADPMPDLHGGADHAKAYREGSSGAVGSSAGGCGCN